MTAIAQLTPRQKTFLDHLLELWREHDRPVHYTELAERLGVNRFSAYDMLKVLERKGFAASSYALPRQAGPGRSMVVFAPTAKAVALLRSAAAEVRLGEDWHRVRERVLDRLRAAQDTSYRDALNELLGHLPEAKSPMTYCTEMVGALLLNIQRARVAAGGSERLHALTTLRQTEDTGLETLAGLSVGMTLAADTRPERGLGEDAGASFSQRLLEQAHRYHTSLTRLSDEARDALVLFLEDALEALD